MSTPDLTPVLMPYSTHLDQNHFLMMEIVTWNIPLSNGKTENSLLGVWFWGSVSHFRSWPFVTGSYIIFFYKLRQWYFNIITRRETRQESWHQLFTSAVVCIKIWRAGWMWTVHRCTQNSHATAEPGTAPIILFMGGGGGGGGGGGENHFKLQSWKINSWIIIQVNKIKK